MGKKNKKTMFQVSDSWTEPIEVEVLFEKRGIDGVVVCECYCGCGMPISYRPVEYFDGKVIEGKFKDIETSLSSENGGFVFDTLCGAESWTINRHRTIVRELQEKLKEAMATLTETAKHLGCSMWEDEEGAK